MAIADALAPHLRPKYRVAIEKRLDQTEQLHLSLMPPTSQDFAEFLETPLMPLNN